jgi:hypothetical protein
MYSHLIDYLCLSIGLGWKVVDLTNLVSIMDQRLDQKTVRNLLDLLTIIIV